MTPEPWMPRAERLGRLRVVRAELKRHLNDAGPVYDAIGDATAEHYEGSLGGRQKIMQLGGRKEHYDFWTGVQLALKAIDTTIMRLEDEDALEQETP